MPSSAMHWSSQPVYSRFVVSDFRRMPVFSAEAGTISSFEQEMNILPIRKMEARKIGVWFAFIFVLFLLV